MPSQSRRQYNTVEVRPDGVASKSNIAPSSPGSPKAVRFAPAFKAEARAPTSTEAWSLYHFEAHARQCPECYNPLEVHLQGRHLCADGYCLAQDVAEHFYRQDGVVYSRKKDNHKLVRIEMPHDYGMVSQFLKSTDRAARSAPRAPPVVSYEPATPRRTELRPKDVYEDERTQVFIEPASAERLPSRTKSKHKSNRYSTVIVDEEIEVGPSTQASERKERRGSLYYDDMQRQRKPAYKVEIREPAPRRERPKSGYYS